ncbi:MAG: FAD-dependent oxidoreductase [Planctomycetaceae bacterium]|nr:FAD-dependent oxidoreductase [Planctomycetaceae bacterium]
MSRPLALVLALASASCVCVPSEPLHDIVIYGGTSGGVIAAVAAARAGRSVVLVEPSQHVGGMTSAGLGATDIGNKRAIGGMAREFYRALRRHYDDPAAWTHERRAEYRGIGLKEGEDTMWAFEPHVAERLFEELLVGAAVRVERGARLDLERGVEKDGTRILSIASEDGRRFRGRIFIDASYEGDLLALAGASFHVGREANSTYGETLNGVQVANATKHQFKVRVDPYVTPGRPESGLLPGISAEQPGPDGSEDARVQAYCFRLCATDLPENRLPWPKPADYDERRYELLLRNLEAGDSLAPWHPLGMPNRKTDSNNNGAVSTDHIGANWDYATASWSERDAIVADHESWQKGLLWTLANSPRVPAPIAEHFASFGLCKDEFVATGGWPHALYIREARRLVGETVMTEHHCRGTHKVARPVGLAAYTMDSHNVQRHVDSTGAVRNEGDVQVGGFPPYGIDYGALLSKRDECSNLLVPVCLSASHIAYGSIRMEPVFMVLGQSCALAANLALERSIDLHDLDYAELRSRLVAAGQVLQ